MNRKYNLIALDIIFVVIVLAVLFKPIVVKKYYYNKLQSICRILEFECIKNDDWGAGIYSDRYIFKFDYVYGYDSCMRMNDLAKVYKTTDNFLHNHILFNAGLPDIYFEMTDSPYELYIEFYRTSDGNWYMDTCADVYFENWNALEGFAGMQSITGVILENDSGLREADPTVCEGLEKLDVRISDKYISQQECDEVVDRFKQSLPNCEVKITAVDYL